MFTKIKNPKKNLKSQKPPQKSPATMSEGSGAFMTPPSENG